MLPLFRPDLWLGSCPLLSFGIHSSVSSLCLLLCVCFWWLRKSVLTPALEGRDYEEVLGRRAAQWSTRHPLHQPLALWPTVRSVSHRPCCCVWVAVSSRTVVRTDSACCGLCLLPAVLVGPQQASSEGTWEGDRGVSKTGLATGPTAEPPNAGTIGGGTPGGAGAQGWAPRSSWAAPSPGARWATPAALRESALSSRPKLRASVQPCPLPEAPGLCWRGGGGVLGGKGCPPPPSFSKSRTVSEIRTDVSPVCPRRYVNCHFYVASLHRRRAGADRQEWKHTSEKLKTGIQTSKPGLLLLWPRSRDFFWALWRGVEANIHGAVSVRGREARGRAALVVRCWRAGQSWGETILLLPQEHGTTLAVWS